ncbi:MAG: hypothetical protein ACYDC4_10160 [Candidatus Dormibacteria bacterium]
MAPHVVIGVAGILSFVGGIFMLRFRPNVEAFLRRQPFRFSPIWYTSLGVPIVAIPLGAYFVLWALT